MIACDRCCCIYNVKLSRYSKTFLSIFNRLQFHPISWRFIQGEEQSETFTIHDFQAFHVEIYQYSKESRSIAQYKRTYTFSFSPFKPINIVWKLIWILSLQLVQQFHTNSFSINRAKPISRIRTLFSSLTFPLSRFFQFSSIFFSPLSLTLTRWCLASQLILNFWFCYFA